MLRKTTKEPLGQTSSIIADVLTNAETSQLITSRQKQLLLHEILLKLSIHGCQGSQNNVDLQIKE